MTFISPVCPHSMQAHRLRRGALSWPTGHASPPAGADQLRRRPHTTHLPHTPNGLRSRATRLSRVTCEALSHSSDRVLASVVTSADNESEAQVLGAPSLPYQGVIFDMDGTLTESNIDFVDMRSRTGIKQGDLFTVMESMDEDSDITRAMDVILELEADACTRLSLKEGTVELLLMLRDLEVPVALVTRNTTSSVDSFFSLIGEEWRAMFSQIMTREYRFVKPDKRLLIDVAKGWDLPPGSLLMVGDSIEDVECGNAAGTATCHILGGGNEVGGAAELPVGAVPTFSVSSLGELQKRLETADVSNGREHAGEAPPGLDFIDAITQAGAMLSGGCSFPRLAEFGGGMVAVGERGERVLHLECGKGGMTKLLASQGLEVVAVDTEVTAVTSRGLMGVKYLGAPLSAMSLAPAAGVTGFDVVVYYGTMETADINARLPSEECIDELWRVLRLGGRFCMESGGVEGDALQMELKRRGFFITMSEELSSGRLRLVARKPGMSDYSSVQGLRKKQ